MRDTAGLRTASARPGLLLQPAEHASWRKHSADSAPPGGCAVARAYPMVSHVENEIASNEWRRRDVVRECATFAARLAHAFQPVGELPTPISLPGCAAWPRRAGKDGGHGSR